MLRVVVLIVGMMAWCGPVAAQSTAGSAMLPATKSDTNKGCPAPEKWMTSGNYLPAVAECLLGPESDNPDPRRVALVQDIQIKAWSYSILNKVTFWIAIALALAILVWPSFVAINAGRVKARKKDAEADADADDDTPTHWSQRATTTSAIQTSIAALAALSFALYGHYKGNQVKAENMMREIIFADDLDADRISALLASIAEMDKGFGFTTVEALKGK